MTIPHGGILVDRMVNEKEKNALLNRVQKLKSITISSWTVSDLELIATGAYSPLTGFMNKENYDSVLTNMRLTNGLIWSIPITLPISKTEADLLNIGDEIILKDHEETIYGSMIVEEIFHYSKTEEAKRVYGTTDPHHPGVKKIFEKEEIYIAGEIKLIHLPPHHPFKDFYMTPLQTRELFSSLGWKTIVGFQTRNPVHRAHEYLHKVALEMVDGLLLHPLIGETKQDDIPADLRMKSYQILLENYYPKNRVRLAVFPASMRYAGLREAVFHAIIRKNYGCTHFIVGRDHAGVGNYYGTYDAQKIFDLFPSSELGINIIKFEHAFYCILCEQMCTTKTCPHDVLHHIHLSGTKVREMLKKGDKPPVQFSRPEVVSILINGLNSNLQSP